MLRLCEFGKRVGNEESMKSEDERTRPIMIPRIEVLMKKKGVL
jgi:hypothetical protein